MIEGFPVVANEVKMLQFLVYRWVIPSPGRASRT